MRKTSTSVFLAFITSLFLGVGCTDSTDKKDDKEMKSDSTETISKEVKTDPSVFGVTSKGDTVHQFKLANEGGVEVNIITFGGIIQSLKTPNKNGTLEEVIYGFSNIADYEADNPFFGAVIGRYGNRIAKGKFTLNGTEYTLPINNNPNHLHGGPNGFYKKNWKGEAFENENGQGVKLTYTSADGEEGYPGNLKTTVTYLLNKTNALEITYEAETDKETIVNLTQHSYFNLSGKLDSEILDHNLVLNADGFIPVDKTLIPTGEIRPVEGTPFDFTTMKKIGKDINKENNQLKLGMGYDHCWVLKSQDGRMSLAATLYDETSGRVMEVHTTEPGIQFYSGNFLDGTLTLAGGEKAVHRGALCLETQHYPDSPNQEFFPTTTLKPGEQYKSKTIFKFSSAVNKN